MAVHRNPALDGIRALAATSIVAAHSGVPFLRTGYGVDVFFVLSGFLITGLLFDEMSQTRRVNLWRFYLRRFLRLTPPLAVLLLFIAASAAWVWPERSYLSILRDVALAGLYLTDYSHAYWAIPDSGSPLSHTWSLSVEEHFYLLWPVITITLFGKGRLWQVALLFGLYIIATEWRIFSLAQWHNIAAIYVRLDTRISGLVCGSLLALLINNWRIGRHAANGIGLAATLTLVVMMLGSGRDHIGKLIWGITVVEIASAALIVSASHEGSIAHRALSTAPLSGLGMISYSLYLWHLPVAQLIPGHWLGRFAAVMALSIALVTLSWVLVERPVRDFRVRRFGRQSHQDRPDSVVR